MSEATKRSSSERETRLTALGYRLPEAPPPAAVYQPFMWTGDQLWVAGQIALSEGSLLATGRVGDEIDLETLHAAALHSVRSTYLLK